MATSPINLKFAVASGAVQGKGLLYRLSPSRTGENPSWKGRGNRITTRESGTPITDKSFWEGRYTLCELTLENNLGDRLVMNDAVVAITRTKNIVTTRIVGMNGTIKEYIDSSDYEISIVVGVIAERDGTIVDEYPTDALRELRTFLDTDEALSVHSDFLDVFDINSLVIKSFSVTQDTASNYQSVSISAVSDEEYNIYSTDY